MKNLFALILAIASASTCASAEQISHATCNLWIPIWKPQGQLSDYEAAQTIQLLQLKGYRNVRFGSSRVADSERELFLGNREEYTRSSNRVRKGKANITLTLQDLGQVAGSAQSVVYTDSKSVQCFFYHSADPASYKDFTQVCSGKLLVRTLLIPDCVKL